jgi:hypothetical protein
MSRQRPDDPALARFYVHLVVVTAIQLAVLVAAWRYTPWAAGPPECCSSLVSGSRLMARLRSVHG